MVTRVLLRLLCLGLLWPAVASAQIGSARIVDGVAAGQADVLGSDPAGTEQGVVVRVIPSGVQHVISDSTSVTTLIQGGNTATINASGRLQVEAVFETSGGTELTASAVDTDDGSIAGGQASVNLGISLNHCFDGTNWPRCPTAAGAVTSSTPRVTEATDSQLSAGVGAVADSAATAGSTGSLTAKLRFLTTVVGVEDVAETAGGGLAMVGTVRRDTAASSAGATGENATLNTDANGKLWTNSEILGGAIAHDAADSGNPLKIGAKATSSLSAQTMVATADRTDLFAGLDGVPIVRLHANLEDRTGGSAAVTDGSSTSVVAAQGAGIRFCATTVMVSNSSATNVTVDLRDGTGGTVLWPAIPAAANMGGAVITFPVPLCTTANTAMAGDPSASATTVTIAAIGFKTKL